MKKLKAALLALAMLTSAGLVEVATAPVASAAPGDLLETQCAWVDGQYYVMHWCMDYFEQTYPPGSVGSVHLNLDAYPRTTNGVPAGTNPAPGGGTYIPSALEIWSDCRRGFLDAPTRGTPNPNTGGFYQFDVEVTGPNWSSKAICYYPMAWPAIAKDGVWAHYAHTYGIYGTDAELNAPISGQGDAFYNYNEQWDSQGYYRPYFGYIANMKLPFTGRNSGAVDDPTSRHIPIYEYRWW